MAKRRNFTEDSHHYIDKVEYTKYLVEFVETGKASERLGELFELHVKRCSSAGRFKNYTYRDEMESVAILHLMKYSTNFDKDKILDSGEPADAFKYCTTIIHHAFTQVINREKKHSKIKDFVIKNQDHIQHEILKYSQATMIDMDEEEKEELTGIHVKGKRKRKKK